MAVVRLEMRFLFFSLQKLVNHAKEKDRNIPHSFGYCFFLWLWKWLNFHRSLSKGVRHFVFLLLLFHSCRTNIDRLLWVLLEPDVHRSFQSGYGDLFIIYQMYWEKTLGPTTTRGMKATCFPNGTLYVCVFRGYHLLGAADCHPSKAHTSHIPVDENRPVRPANVNLFITKSPHWLAIDLFFYHTHTISIRFVLYLREKKPRASFACQLGSGCFCSPFLIKLRRFSFLFFFHSQTQFQCVVK